jgi:site-specific recombinase XerD
MTSTATRPRGPKLLQQLREALRVHHYGPRTEEAYVAWVRRYVRFHGLRHPGELEESEIRRFLTALAARGRLSASSQTQALSALLYLYREVLRREPGDLGELIRAKQPARLPVVLTRESPRVPGEVGKPPAPGVHLALRERAPPARSAGAQ